MANEIVKVKISESIELLIEGLPKSIVSPEIQTKAALSLVRYAIPTEGVIPVGVLAGVKTAVLQIANEIYHLKYSINVLKVVTALEIYSEAVQWIEFQKASNRVDSEMADDAISYLRSEFRREFRNQLPGDPTTDAPPPSKK